MRPSILSAALVLSLAVSSLRADFVHMDGFAYHRDVAVNLFGTDETLRTGQNLLSLNGAPDQVAYCVDLGHALVNDWIGSLTSVTVLNNGPMVAYLYNTYAPLVNDDDSAASLQLAIWKVISDSPINLDFSTGNLKVPDGQPGLAGAIAELSTLPATYGDFPPPIVVYSSDNPQSQSMLIPEPASLCLSLLAGAMLIRCRQRRA